MAIKEYHPFMKTIRFTYVCPNCGNRNTVEDMAVPSPYVILLSDITGHH